MSHEVLDLLYLYYLKGNDHQTWQDGDLPWEASTHRYTTLWTHGHMRSCDKYISVIYFHYCNALVTKPGRVVPYNKELPSLKSQDPLIIWFWKVTCQINRLLPTTTWSMAIKLGKVVSYSKELPHIKSHNPLNTFITTRPLAIKYDKLVTYSGVLPPIK